MASRSTACTTKDKLPASRLHFAFPQRALVTLVGPPPQPHEPSKGGPDRWAAAVWLPHLRTGAWTMAR